MIKKLEKKRYKEQLSNAVKIEKMRLSKRELLIRHGFKESEAEKESLRWLKEKQKLAGVGWRGKARELATSTKESKVVQGTMNILSETLSKLSVPLAAFAGIGGLIAMLIDAHSKMKKITGDFISAEQASGEWIDALEDPASHIEELNKATAKTNELFWEFGITAEDNNEILKELGQAGVRVHGQIVGANKELVKTISVMSGVTGESLQQVSSTVGDWMKNLNMNVNQVHDSFAELATDASKSGIGVNRFISTIQSASSSMSLFGQHVIEDSILLKNMARTGVLGGKDLVEAFERMRNSTKSMSRENKIFLFQIPKMREEALRMFSDEMSERESNFESLKKAGRNQIMENRTQLEAQGKNVENLQKEYDNLMETLKAGGNIEPQLSKLTEAMPEIGDSIKNVRTAYAEVSLFSKKLKSAKGGDIFGFEQAMDFLSDAKKLKMIVKNIKLMFGVDNLNELAGANRVVVDEMLKKYDQNIDELSKMEEGQKQLGKTLDDMFDQQDKDGKLNENLPLTYKKLVDLGKAGKTASRTLEDVIKNGFETLENKIINLITFLDTAKIAGIRVFGGGAKKKFETDSATFKEGLQKNKDELIEISKAIENNSNKIEGMKKAGEKPEEIKKYEVANEELKKEYNKAGGKIQEGIDKLNKDLSEIQKTSVNDYKKVVLSQSEGFFDWFLKSTTSINDNLLEIEDKIAEDLSSSDKWYKKIVGKYMKFEKKMRPKDMLERAGGVFGEQAESEKMLEEQKKRYEIINTKRIVKIAEETKKESTIKEPNTEKLVMALGWAIDKLVGLIPSVVKKKVAEHSYLNKG